MILISTFKQCNHHWSTTGLKYIPYSPQNSDKNVTKKTNRNLLKVSIITWNKVITSITFISSLYLVGVLWLI